MGDKPIKRLVEEARAQGFTQSDLTAEAFTFKQGERAGTLGVSMKARLLRIAWAKVDGQPFYTESERAA